MKKIIYVLTAAAILAACNPTKKTTTEVAKPKEETKTPEPKLYRASNTRVNDVQHVKLNVSFDWDKKYLYGQEWITLKPHFYATDHLDLNARGMEINAVAMWNDKDNTHGKKVVYQYENDSIKVSKFAQHLLNLTLQSYILVIV